MKLVIEALEAARAHLGREYLDGRQPTASTAPTGEKIDRALAAIADGQAVTTADVEAWASSADVFELGQAALAIRARNRVIAAKLDELERPALLQQAAPGRAEKALPASAETLELVLEFVETADVAELEQLALAIRGRVAGVADELDGAKFQ